MKSDVAADGIANGGAYENIRRKVRLESDAREVDQCGDAVGDPRNPLVISIAAFENRGDGEGFLRVTGRKAVGDKAVSVEKSVAEIAVRGDADRPRAVRRFLTNGVEDHGIGGGFAGKERGLLCKGIFAPEADQVNGAGADEKKSVGVYLAEVYVEVAELVSLTEVRSVVRIACDKASGDGNNREGREPVLSVEKQVVGESDPHVFLIFEEILGERLPGDVPLGRDGAGLQ